MIRFDRNRAAALLLLFALCFGVLTAILAPAVMKWREDGARIQKARLSMLQAEEDRRALHMIAESGTKWHGFAADEAAGFVQAETGEDAIGTVQDYLSDAITSRGGRVSVANARHLSEAETRERIDVIGIELTAILPSEQLAPALFEIESEPPFAIVDAMTVSSATVGEVSLRLEGRLFRFGETR